MRNNNYVSYRRRGLGNSVEVVVFDKLSNVENLLNKLKDRIKTEGKVTVADYYELTGAVVVEGDCNYGWTDLLDCQITITRYGYELSMPMTKPVNVDHLREAYDALLDVHEDEYTPVGVSMAKDHLEQLMNK